MKALAVLAALALTSCVATISADGSKSVSVDGPSVIALGKVIAQK